MESGIGRKSSNIVRKGKINEDRMHGKKHPCRTRVQLPDRERFPGKRRGKAFLPDGNVKEKKNRAGPVPFWNRAPDFLQAAVAEKPPGTGDKAKNGGVGDIVKLAGVIDNFAVETALKAVDPVIRVGFIEIIGDALKIVQPVTALQRPADHFPLQ